MSRFWDVYNEAHALYVKDRKHDAAVTFEQARRIAQADRMAAEAAHVGVLAAMSWTNAAHPLHAYNLLLDILSTAEDDLEPLDRWSARTFVFNISHHYFPELDKLQQRLERLSQLQQEYPQFPRADVHQMTGWMLQAQGQWQTALKAYERSWVEFNGDGYVKFQKALSAAECNLYLNNNTGAQRWCDLLGETEIEQPGSRVYWYTMRSHLSLYQGNYAQAEAHAMEAEKKTEMIQFGAGGPFLIRVRTLLLQADLGDPTHPNHPARFRLRQRFQGKPIVDDVYGRILLIADYRLASVRYGLGVPAVDDQWYQQPQQLPSRLPPEFQRPEYEARVKSTRRAIGLALKRATAFDGAFQCQWRQEEVQQRQARLDALVHAVESL